VNFRLPEKKRLAVLTAETHNHTHSWKRTGRWPLTKGSHPEGICCK